MRTRRFPSSLRTAGRLHRHGRRFVVREAAAGRAVPAPTIGNARNVVKIMRDMYTHVRFAPLGGRTADYMNRRVGA